MSVRSGQPLVYTTAPAREQAARLLGKDVVLENEIAEWITNGSVRGARKPVFSVISPDGRIEALVSRRPGEIRPHPRQWLVHALRTTTPRR